MKRRALETAVERPGADNLIMRHLLASNVKDSARCLDVSVVRYTRWTVADTRYMSI